MESQRIARSRECRKRVQKVQKSPSEMLRVGRAQVLGSEPAMGSTGLGVGGRDHTELHCMHSPGMDRD